jgi:predicted nicotinamide N-methyase
LPDGFGGNLSKNGSQNEELASLFWILTHLRGFSRSKMDDIPNPTTAFLPETPFDAVSKRVCEPVVIDGRTFVIYRPADSYQLLDHPAIHSAFSADEYMPYWTDLWPGSRMLAKAILRETWTPSQDVLELGCGLGLPGIAALACGLKVTFSDYDATALRFAADNARANGFDDFRLVQFDWRCQPDSLSAAVILCADLIYEIRNVAPLVALIKQVLQPEGVCLLTDQDRPPAHLLRETLTATGLGYSIKVMHAGEAGGRRVRGSLYRIRHAQ